MPILEINVGRDFDDPGALHRVVEDVTSSFNEIVTYGGYGVVSEYQPAQIVETVVSGPESVRLTTVSSLFDLEPAAFRHLSTALRYECRKQHIPASMQVMASHQEWLLKPRPAADVSRALVSDPFRLDVQWTYRRMSLELTFAGDLEAGLVPYYDARVAAWARFSRYGAYCADEQLFAADEDVDVGIYADMPCVGRDFVEWSLVPLEVPADAVDTLVNMFRHLEGAHERVLEMAIG